MEASFESVCDSIPWKADRKLAYRLVKNNKTIFHKAIGSVNRFFWFFKDAVYTLTLIDPSVETSSHYMRS
jgi:hypothetical protein